MYAEDLLKFFDHNNFNDIQSYKIEEVNKMAKALGGLIIQCTPSCPEQTLAIRKLHECVMYVEVSLIRENME